MFVKPFGHVYALALYRLFFFIIIKVADSGIEEQDEGDEDDRMKVSIVISVEDEMGRHIDVNIEDEAGQIDIEKPGEI